MILRLALGLTLLFVLPIALIRAQPYDNPALHNLLASTANCTTPCLIGIQPGITSEAEAIAHFNHAENINYAIVQENFGETVLHWRDTTSPFSGQIYLNEGHVTEVTLQGARLYDVWFALGEPDGGAMMANEMINVGQNVAFNLPYAHTEYYASHDLRVETAANCPRFWEQLVYITLTAEPISESTYPNPLGNRRRQICESQRVYQRLRD